MGNYCRVIYYILINMGWCFTGNIPDVEKSGSNFFDKYLTIGDEIMLLPVQQ